MPAAVTAQTNSTSAVSTTWFSFAANVAKSTGVADKDVVNVFDGEHEATHAKRVRRCMFQGPEGEDARRTEGATLVPATTAPRGRPCARC